MALHLYVAWRKYIRQVFRLPWRAHTHIVSRFGYNCIIERLDLRQCKYIYNLLHSNNSTVKSFTNHTLLLYPKSLMSGNYKHLMYKYKLCHLDWTMRFNCVIVSFGYDDEIELCHCVIWIGR